MSQTITPRELEILKLVSEGDANKTIAEKVKLSEQTVKNHISIILTKLGANNRTHAVSIAVKEHLLPSYRVK